MLSKFGTMACALALLGTSCKDSDTPDASVGDAAPPLDATTPDAGTDASVPMDARAVPDAESPDSTVLDADTAPDAQPPPDAGTSDTVRVYVSKDGAPESGAVAVFHNADGTVASTATTDGTGFATGSIMGEGLVTVAVGPPEHRQLTTYFGVKAGDELDVVERTSRLVSITLANNNPGGGISVVAGNFLCSTNASSAGTVAFFVTPDCYRGSTFPVLSYLRYGPSSYFSHKKGNAIGSTTVAGLSPWTEGTLVTLNMTNVPPTNEPQAWLGQIAEGEAYQTPPERPIMIANGSATSSFSISTDYPEALQAEIQSIVREKNGAQHIQTFARRTAVGSELELDVGAGFLPQILSTGVELTQEGRPSLSWQSEAPLTDADIGTVTTSFTPPGTSNRVDWTFIIPPLTNTIQVPALPSSMVADTPVTGSNIKLPSVAFFDTDRITGYEASKAATTDYRFHRVPVGEYTGAITPALPGDGILRTTTFAVP